VRLYLPATLDELDPLGSDDPTIGLAPRVAHAVTPQLRAALPDEDEEGLEFAAHLAAADDSLALLAARPAAPALRLVVTVDVPDELVGDGPDDAAPSAVLLVAPAPVGSIACAHVDEPSASADVRAAVAGDADAVERVGELDLLWYDAAELGDIPR